MINILLEGMGTSIGENSEMVPLRGFLFDMNRFFQALISRFLHDELADFSIQDEHALKGIFEYDKANNPQRHRVIVPRPDFAVLSHSKVIEFLDAKYMDLWETPLPANILYQLAIYAMSKSTGKPRSTILFPRLAAQAVEQVILLKYPVEGNRRAEIVLRPVNLFELERLTRPRNGYYRCSTKTEVCPRARVWSGTSLVDTVPIRLTQTPATCRVRPFAGI